LVLAILLLVGSVVREPNRAWLIALRSFTPSSQLAGHFFPRERRLGFTLICLRFSQKELRGEKALPNKAPSQFPPVEEGFPLLNPFPPLPNAFVTTFHALDHPPS